MIQRAEPRSIDIRAVPKPLSDGSAFQCLFELMMMLQLATAASKLVPAPCEAPLCGKLPFRCKRCSRDFEIDFIKRDLI